MGRKKKKSMREVEKRGGKGKGKRWMSQVERNFSRAATNLVTGKSSPIEGEGEGKRRKGRSP